MEVSDGYVYCQLHRNFYLHIDSQAIHFFDIRKVRKDDFSVIWETRLGDQVTLAANQLIMTHDSGFIAIGEGFDTLVPNPNPDSLDQWARTGWIIRLNNDGSLKWKKGYQYIRATLAESSIHTFYDIAELPCGDIVAVGESDIGNVHLPYYEQGWMIRVDSNGCLIPHCDMPNAISEVEGNKISWKVSPNPFNKELYIYFDGTEGSQYSMQLTDIQGRIIEGIKTLRNNTTYTLSTDNLESGLYIATLLKGSRILESMKVIKE